ncbi:conserved hypothetical protein [Aspergillus terreus NIH2624]|uniref:Cyclin C-terminal domain-containing protein n=1 Tax=Aspergillus terreus (strain NIH 2624 / FGSC A1156) TaxID=341663 RepID=Q0CRN8_ASPTN|nr:uncharacterized protein ATEG_03646 [Aspergillus terreus NIH2624]EAU35448.1 conserved hypothetical protein [Aspergillus terreus NIH2624]
MFVQMEWHVLQTLDWTIGHPTIDSFLQVAVMDTPYDPEVEHMALYISEISQFHREFVSKPSSDLAKASLALARCILNRPQPRHTEWASQYDSMTLVGLSQQLHQPSQVLCRKYSSSHYSRVSKILEQFLARQASIASYSPPSPPESTLGAQALRRRDWLGHAAKSTPPLQHALMGISHPRLPLRTMRLPTGWLVRLPVHRLRPLNPPCPLQARAVRV